MQTIRLTMAQALLQFLDQQYLLSDGVEHKFVHGVAGIFGHGNVTGIGEALEYGSHNLQYVQGKSEQGMVHTAVAFARQHHRRRIIACTSSIGPGALNMITAAATATVNRIPVLLLPGDNFASRQPDPVLQQIEHASDYSTSATDAFRPVSVFWDRINRPEQLLTALPQAMRMLTDPASTGAVTLALPQDVQAEAYDYPVSFFAKRVHDLERRPPAQRALEQAVELITSKKRPLIIAGGGVLYSEATQALAAFAEAFQLPVAVTQAGKSALPWSHPLHVGAVGVTGTLAANTLARDADLIIGIGTRYSDFTTASKSAFACPDVAFINLNVNSLDTAKLGGLPLTADARTGLQALHDLLQAASYQSDYAPDYISNLRKAWDEEVSRLHQTTHPEGMTQTAVLGTLERVLPESSVIVCAAGSLPGDLHRIWTSKQPGSYHMEYGFSCMGYEIAGALGVAMAAPEREVYAFVGDGSYLMLHTELVTSLQEQKKITILLFDNHGFQCIHNLQRANGSMGFGNEFRYRSADNGRLTGDYLPIDFAANARSLGAAAYQAETPEQLEEALQLASQETVTTLIWIRVVPGTGTDGYESWWNVGVPEVSNSAAVTQAGSAMNARIRSTPWLL